VKAGALPFVTNLILRSEEFQLSPWVRTTINVVPNYAPGPTGTEVAELLTASGSNARLEQPVTATATTHTYSVMVRKENFPTARIAILNQTTGTNVVADLTVNLETGAFSSIVGTPSIQYGSYGWLRVGITNAGVITAGNTLLCRVYVGTTTGHDLVAVGAMLESGAVMNRYVASGALQGTEPVTVNYNHGVACGSDFVYGDNGLTIANFVNGLPVTNNGRLCTALTAPNRFQNGIPLNIPSGYVCAQVAAPVTYLNGLPIAASEALAIEAA